MAGHIITLQKQISKLSDAIEHLKDAHALTAYDELIEIIDSMTEELMDLEVQLRCLME